MYTECYQHSIFQRLMLINILSFSNRHEKIRATQIQYPCLKVDDESQIGTTPKLRQTASSSTVINTRLLDS